MYTVMHIFTDQWGERRSARWNMRGYKRLDVAVRAASKVRFGYVTRLGGNEPVALGSWQR
jgi:hypothetical protein